MVTILKCITLFYIQAVKSMSIQRPSFIMDNSGPESEITDLIYSKGYLPYENDLPRSKVIKNVDSDVTYLLSKLSDDELIKLLNDQPKKSSYDLNDIVKITLGAKYDKDRKKYSLGRELQEIQGEKNLNKNNKRFQISPQIDNAYQAFYKLGHKAIIPKEQKNEVNFMALKKLHDLINYSPQHYDNELTDEKKELLFDILISQLKTLCCKSDKPSHTNLSKNTYASKILTNIPKEQASVNQKSNEFMFLIVNDEIKSRSNDDLIIVDPETLEKNSSVLLLGPITTPLTDEQLKVVMDRISNELSKPEYTTLLQQLADGTLSENNMSLMKKNFFGHESRRYMKPHRCNYQSKLAKIYSGPRWLICTGYLNLNTPSLYD